MSKNITSLSGRKGLDDNLFEKIGQHAEADGYLTRDAAHQLAEEYLIGDAAVYGTGTFYDFTRPENKDKKVFVCNGTACLCAGTQDELRKKLLQHFEPDEIGEMTCLGRCHENHAFHYQGRNFSGREALALLDEALPRAEAAPADTYAVAATGQPILTTPDYTLDQARALVEKLIATRPQQLLDEIHAARLRGRGGAGFPIGIKLEACAKAEGDVKFIVCNADEGDPGSYSDRYLLEQRPVKLLLGMLIAGRAAGAERGVVYIRYEYPDSVEAVRRAIRTLEAAGLLGHDILGSGFRFLIKPVKARGSYICGEETALLASIEGQRPEVRVRPPYPVQYGLFGKPTVVNNVETLANLPWILEHGGAAFAAIGTEKSTGTKLLSLDSAFRRPGVYEVAMGTPLRTVVDELGQGFRKPVKALHIGGPLGGLVPVGKIDELTVDFESFAQAGFLLGHASVVSVPEDFPMIGYLEHLFAFTAHESCGKCFPCRIGSVRGKELLHKARTEGYRIDRALFDDLLLTLKEGSLCALGGGMPLPVYNALQYFGDELEAYFR